MQATVGLINPVNNQPHRLYIGDVIAKNIFVRRLQICRPKKCTEVLMTFLFSVNVQTVLIFSVKAVLLLDACHGRAGASMVDAGKVPRLPRLRGSVGQKYVHQKVLPLSK